MLQNLGLSTSYFSARGFSIYDSVKRAYELGFRLIELGANHSLEGNLFATINNIRHDFPDATFTQHCFFPPVLGNFFSNSAQGLSNENQQVIDAIFKAAKILNSRIISFHTGLNSTFTYKGISKQWGGFKEFVSVDKIPQPKALNNMKEFLGLMLIKAKENHLKVALENIIGWEGTSTTLTNFSEFENFLNEFPDLNFLFDFGHGYIVHKDDCYKFFDFGPRIIEMHIDDVNQKLHDHRVLGQGILNLDKMFKGIKKLAPMPILILEHSAEVTEQEILGEVKLVEKYLG
ncbi:MAG: TIM barrel protein [Candidatus Gottesmanbacteria bacterium]